MPDPLDPRSTTRVKALADTDLTIVYLHGEENVVADCLSRIEMFKENDRPVEKQGTKVCTRAQKKINEQSKKINNQVDTTESARKNDKVAKVTASSQSLLSNNLRKNRER